MRDSFRQSKLGKIAVAAACVLVALIARLALDPVLEERGVHLFFLIASLAAAWYSGVLAGFAALALGVGLAQTFFTHRQDHPFGVSDWTYFAIGSLVNLSGILVVVALRRALLRAEQARQLAQRRGEQLRTGMRERTEAEAASRQALEAERSRYRELFDSAPVGYIISTLQGVIEQANAAAAELLNERAQFLTGFPMARFLAKEDRETFFALIRRLTRQEVEKVESWEVTLRPQMRVPFPCSITVNLVRNQADQAAGLRWLIRDISERKQAEQKVLRLNAELEQRVRDRTADLQKANQELEAFSFSVSHDLRAPLRSISGFSKAVLEEYGSRLDAQGVKYLQCVHDASRRMNQLIEDLLAFSRYTRCEMRRQEVDLSALAEGIVRDLRQSDPKREVKVTIAPGLKTTGDEALLRIALQNLLENAWKFTGRKAHPQIEVGTAEENGSTSYFVRDNGAGFSMAHAQRLFGVFQRLHSTEEFPGTGVGLATVRRIFHRHGGDIWAQSEVEKGATFFFALSKAGHPAEALPAAPPPAEALAR